MVESLVERVAADLVRSKYAIALTGAGISTESGIPDFRGPNGIWTKNPEAERAAYQIYDKFLRDPKEYWQAVSGGVSVYHDLRQAEPNPGHCALAEMEKLGILKCVITQNIDGLHRKAGSRRVLEYHGAVNRLRCPSCSSRFEFEEYEMDGADEPLLPLCKKCQTPIKLDVVHFNEPIPSDVARQSLEETWKCDVMLICGTSAVVYPFAQLPRIARQRKVEQEQKAKSGLYFVKEVAAATIVEVNAEPTPLTQEGISDYIIQGKTGDILPQIVAQVKRFSR
ncbi:MAG: NAD-dependent deacylase [Chloroflexi bacterium]|nr:NAD-dependent deacylase [Chloroflexota bacterium]